MNRDLALQLHPDSHCEAVTSINARAVRSAGDMLTLEYVVTGTTSEIRMPAETRGERRDGLWQHTCFEAFVRTTGPTYYEFNFAPSMQWAAYAFADYRTGMQTLELEAPRTEIKKTDASFLMSCLVDLDGLPNLPLDSPWSLGLSAVIEEMNGTKSYWALAHPPGAPDFHHKDCFALELPAARSV